MTDSRGVTLKIASAPKRIVSLSPSNTEILFALGLGKRIAGDTTACDFPPEALRLPHVGGFQTSVESVEILNPDLVVAVRQLNRSAVDTLAHAGVPVFTVDTTTLNDLYLSIMAIGRATGSEEAARRLCLDMQSRIARIHKTVQRDRSLPRVLMAYSASPIYTTGSGSYIDDVITLAGGVNVVNGRLPGDTISPEQALIARPDVIVCDPAIEPQLSRIPGWQAMPAVRSHRFFHSSAPLVRPGPRLALAAEQLSRFLHPGLFSTNSLGTSAR